MQLSQSCHKHTKHYSMPRAFMSFNCECHAIRTVPNILLGHFTSVLCQNKCVTATYKTSFSNWRLGKMAVWSLCEACKQSATFRSVKSTLMVIIVRGKKWCEKLLVALLQGLKTGLDTPLENKLPEFLNTFPIRLSGNMLYLFCSLPSSFWLSSVTEGELSKNWTKTCPFPEQPHAIHTHYRELRITGEFLVWVDYWWNGQWDFKKWWDM